MSFLFFRGDGAFALITEEQPSEYVSDFLPLFWPRLLRHYTLACFKKFLRDKWFVRTLVHLAIVSEYTVVKGVGEYPLDIGNGKLIAAPASQSGRSYALADIIERVIAACVDLKHFVHQKKSFGVRDEGMRAQVVEIPKRRVSWQLSAAQLLPESALRILGEIVDEVLGLPKRDIEHELSLRCRLKPKTWRFERLDFASIDEVDDATAVYAVSRKTIRMPTEDTLRLFMLNFFEHRVEHRTPRRFRRLRFAKYFCYQHSFARSKLA